MVDLIILLILVTGAAYLFVRVVSRLRDGSRKGRPDGR